MPLMQGIDDSEKPYIEYLAGRAVPKVSPQRRHAIVQERLWAILSALARGRGVSALRRNARPRRSSAEADHGMRTLPRAFASITKAIASHARRSRGSHSMCVRFLRIWTAKKE